MNFLKKLVLISTMPIIILLSPGGPVLADVKLVKGQTVYIPSYSNIINESYRIILRANLVIHNTDPSQAITVSKIDHYDTKGKLVEQYLSKPIELGPLAATRILIKKPETSDEGAGSNFVIQWRAQNLVTEPLIECIMAGAHATQGYSFTSRGRVILEEKD